MLEFLRQQTFNEFDQFVDYYHKRGLFADAFKDGRSKNVQAFWKSYKIECPQLSDLACHLSQIPVLVHFDSACLTEKDNFDLPAEDPYNIRELFRHVRVYNINQKAVSC